jgi:hypothetical protein
MLAIRKAAQAKQGLNGRARNLTNSQQSQRNEEPFRLLLLIKFYSNAIIYFGHV